MPDIGFLELILVGVIAFLVLGPERMPELFGQIGRVVRKGRGWIQDVRQQIDAETALLKNPLHDVEDRVKGGIDSYNAAIMKELGEALPEAKNATPTPSQDISQRDSQLDDSPVEETPQTSPEKKQAEQ
ncbi:MAG: twin-arginine translocase TatA/TatE family subunit [Mariprofundus sp.]|nr:twin-arginine translocase TatA/TatE family subunit [Mariprofundus sp.]